MVMISCPKCQKQFTHPNYLSKAKEKLDSHLARKNPCDSGTYVIEKKVTGIVPALEDLDITGVTECLDPNIRYCHVASRIFKHVMDLNKFATWPNTKLDEVWFREGGMTLVASPGAFLMHYWSIVFQGRIVPVLEREWPQYTKYKLEVQQGQGHWDFIRSETYRAGIMNAFMKSELYRDLKSAVCGHLKQVPKGERAQIKVNMATPIPAETIFS
jgi:hypothetical protein